jgi:hypothetical protein
VNRPGNICRNPSRYARDVWVSTGIFEAFSRRDDNRVRGRKRHAGPHAIWLRAYFSREHTSRRLPAGCSARRGGRSVVILHEPPATRQCARRQGGPSG